MTEYDVERCPETASAVVSHYMTAVTFGHVCKKDSGHDGVHECICRYGWHHPMNTECSDFPGLCEGHLLP